MKTLNIINLYYSNYCLKQSSRTNSRKQIGTTYKIRPVLFSWTWILGILHWRKKEKRNRTREVQL